MKKQQLINRITDYLASGGLFNPELMEPEKVQRLLIDIRDHLMETQYHPFIPSTPWKVPDNPPHCSKCGIKLEGVMGYVCSQPHCPTGLGGTWCDAS